MVGDITVTAYTADGHLDSDADYVDELRDAASRARDAVLLVAAEEERPDEVLGTATFCLAGTPYAELARPGEAEFRMLAVAPQARGRGVGKELVSHCIELAREAGSSALVMCSMQSMTAAHHIYEKFGFKRAPDRDWEPVPGLVLVGFALPLRAENSRSGDETEAAEFDGEVVRRS